MVNTLKSVRSALTSEEGRSWRLTILLALLLALIGTALGQVVNFDASMTPMRDTLCNAGRGARTILGAGLVGLVGVVGVVLLALQNRAGWVVLGTAIAAGIALLTMNTWMPTVAPGCVL